MATHVEQSSQVTVTLDPADVTRLWWVPLILGAGWLALAMVILQFDIGSVRTISWLIGIVLIGAALNQLTDVVVSSGWRWLHAGVGVVYFVVGIAAFAWPGMTFVVAANLLAWYLLIKGVTDIVMSLSGRRELQFWGLLLLTGVLEVGVAFWAVGYNGRSLTLLALWVGFGAIAKGITNILTAFEIRELGAERASAVGNLPTQPRPPAEETLTR